MRGLSRFQLFATKFPRSVVRMVETALLFTWLLFKDWRAGRELKAVQMRVGEIRDGDIVLAVCLRNEAARLPSFANYYRQLGVRHFLVVDNDSSDGLMEWARSQPDVSVWHTSASYKGAEYGMLWINDLLRRHASGHWCVVCDPDEFLVYPRIETRDLNALTSFLDEDERPVMHALLLDAYSNRPLSETPLGAGDDPFAVCPYFDRDGYLQEAGWGGTTWIRGGPRMRVHFKNDVASAPALNKIPLIKWKWYYHYRSSMHDARPRRLNEAHASGRVSVTGALFHFKFVASFAAKATEEAERGEHWGDGVQYASYRMNDDPNLYLEGISEAYSESDQLVGLGLISPGTWF